MSGQGTRLVCEGVTKAFRRRRVLDDVRLEVEAGRALVLLGSSGAGKSVSPSCRFRSISIVRQSADIGVSFF